MQEDNRPLFFKAVVAFVLLIILIICFALSKGNNKFTLPGAASSTATPVVINAPVLQNWLPPVSYDYVLGRIGDYVNSSHTKLAYAEVQGDVSIKNERTYDFTLLFMPQKKKHAVSVKISNFDSVISTAVSIDGKVQGYGVPSANGAGTVFSGTDALITKGVTSVQVKSLQGAFHTFAPTAGAVSIQADSIHGAPSSDSSSGVYIRTFKVKVDKKTYTAQLQTKGLISMRLLLQDTAGKQVYDSGFVDH
ncbi:MAG TPA: hypothetical protein VLE74_02660 [Candidatus Saccharimonadales bacterium]|nr:hypothetical protein [Candidatus Saccharimonadales bacterium]